MKLLFMKYAERERGGRTEFTEEELASVMTGQAPGTPNMSIISFHGRWARLKLLLKANSIVWLSLGDSVSDSQQT